MKRKRVPDLPGGAYEVDGRGVALLLRGSYTTELRERQAKNGVVIEKWGGEPGVRAAVGDRGTGPPFPEPREGRGTLVSILSGSVYEVVS